MNEPNPTDNSRSDFFKQKRKFAVKRTGRQVARMQSLIKLTSTVMLSLLVFTLLLYCVFIVIIGGTGEENGSFTVIVDKGSRNLLSLSENSDLSNRTIKLDGTSVKDLWHCTYSWIPENIDEISVGGDNSSVGLGDKDNPSYLAYSYYLINESEKDIEYNYKVCLISKELDIDEAIRIMLIRNGEKKIFKKAPVNDTPGEENMIEFLSDDVYKEETVPIKKNGVDKFTFVIWVEGNDPQCVNDILSGKITLSVDMTAIQDS